MSGEIGAALALGGSALLVALSGAMAPGPFLTVTITRTLTRGRLSAALMLVGHAILEGLLLVGFAFGLQVVLQDPRVAKILALVGGVVLLWMGSKLLRDAISAAVSLNPTASVPESSLGPIVQGMMVSLSSPYWTLWWATIGVKLASDGLAIGPLGVLAFFIGHELGDIMWYGFVIAAVSKGRDILSDTAYRVLIAGCALFLLYLGARFALDGVGVP